MCVHRGVTSDSVVTTIIRGFLKASSNRFLINAVVKDILIDLKLNCTDFVQICQTLNCLVLFKLNNTSDVECELDVKPILETCCSLVFSLKGDNMHCCKPLCDLFQNALSLVEREQCIEYSLSLQQVEADLLQFSLDTDYCIFSVKRSIFLLERLITFWKVDSKQGNSHILVQQNVQKLLITLLFSSNSDVACEILMAIIPKLLANLDDNGILVQIWGIIEQFKIDQKLEENVGQILVVMCALGDYFVGPAFNKLNYILEFHETFWKLLQRGLVSQDMLQRKESLYLLKRSVDFFGTSKKSFCELKIFWWDLDISNELLEIWESVYLLFEVLEEKQIHLITPAFSSLNRILVACKSPFTNGFTIHSSWLLCIVNRILCHDSNSIIKLGIIAFMSIDVCIYCKEFSHSNLLFQILKSLNDMFLFEIVENNSCVIGEVLSNWFIGWSKCEHNPMFFSELFSQFLNVCWSPIPLFHIANSLTHISRRPCLDKCALNKLKVFVSEALRTQCVFIRGAIQCKLLKALTLLADADILDIINIADVLISFKSNECLKRNTEAWNICALWLSSTVKKENARDFLIVCRRMLLISRSECNITPHAMARMVVMLHDANLVSCNDPQNHDLFDSIYDCLHECSKRPYSCKITQDICVRFLMHIMGELEVGQISQCPRNDSLQKIISSFLNDLIELVKIRLESANFSTDLSCIELYTSLLTYISYNNYFFKLLSTEINSLHSMAHKILTGTNSNLVQQLFSLKINCWILLNTPAEQFTIDSNVEILFRNLIKKVIKLDFNMLHDREDCTYKLQNSFTKLVSGCIYSLWELLEIYLLRCGSIINIDNEDELKYDYLLQRGIEAMSTGGRECVISVLSVFKVVFQKSNDIKQIKEAISVGWETCFELRKSDLFRPAIGNWISMVYQRSFLEREVFHPLLLEYGDKLVTKSNDVAGLLNALIVQIQSLSPIADITLFANIITECIIFGPLQKKDDRFEVETCNYIKSLKTECAVNTSNMREPSVKLDAEVRISAIDIVLTSANSFGPNILILIVKKLISICNDLSKNNKRYFNDSRHHRIKHRILQALLIFEAFIVDKFKDNIEDLAMEMFNWTVNSLMGESQQPSVRYQLEWLFIRMIIHYNQLRSQFWSTFKMAANERIGSICSFISIAYHLASVFDDSQFLENCVENIFPWCMAQNFNVRLYAQIVLQKLWDINGNISDKYSVLKRCQLKVCDQGNATLNMKKMESDFYFSTFDPIGHFTLQILFWDLPRLANIASDELVPLTTLRKCFVHNLSFINFGLEENELTKYSCASWINKGSERSTCSDAHAGIQKKFVPWKGMFQVEEELSSKGEIIVVASLIDKPPNLGGLARTCEVFSAAELVLGSLKFVEDKQFTSLSLTAEKHINISEVRPHNLDQYLRSMKDLGYSIVGAEQTSDSIPLSEFEFPTKTVLVLGNEREGIPVNLLPLLNKCIEVPQFGVVRSLNVHVTGAIFLWEYAKQHYK